MRGGGGLSDCVLEPPPGLPPPPNHDAYAHPFRAVARDPLPIPVRFAAPSYHAPGNRTHRSHGGRKAARNRSVIQTLECLNILYKGPSQASGESAGGVWPSFAQCGIVDHVRRSVTTLGSPPPDLTEAEAMSRLRLSLAYDEHVSGPVSYDPGRVSLPDSGTQQLELCDLWGEGGTTVVRDFVSAKLIPKEAARANVDMSGPARPYGDPVLKDPHVYGAFLLRLEAAGVIEFTREKPLERVDCFFCGEAGRKTATGY